jgi:hypothetical protein
MGATVTGSKHLGLLTVPVAVNGRPGRFALDTGAPTSVVTSAFATRASMRRAEQAAREVRDGSGGTLRAVPAVADELLVGELARRPAALTMLELPPALGLDGLLSPWDFARGLDFVVDAAARSLRLGSAASGEERQVARAMALCWVEGVPRVRAGVGNEPAIIWTRALVDSGAVGNVLCSHLASRLRHPVAETSAGLGAGGTVTMRHGQALMVRVDEAEAEPMPVLVKRCAADPSALVAEPAGVVLGLPWLRSAPLRFPARRDVALVLQGRA